MKTQFLNKQLFVLFGTLLWLNSVNSQIVITVTDSDLNANVHYNWTNDKTYLLDGLVYLESGSTLTIQEGTIIKAKESPTNGTSTSALIITRGAKIQAIGTLEKPIIFTTEFDDVNVVDDLTFRDNGFWGGIYLLGYGVIARPFGEDQVDGISSNELRGRFGGSNDEDSSGRMSYVSIRHTGESLAPGNDNNALTLAGCGSGTIIDHIEAYANQDDGVQVFGGKVNLKYIISAFSGDDGIEFDFGWRGKAQFVFMVQDVFVAGKALEGNGAQPDGEEPFSKPHISNVTAIGSGLNSNAGNDYAIYLRDRSGGFFYNSIFQGFRYQLINLEDLPSSNGSDCYENFINGFIQIVNNYFYEFGAGDDWPFLVYRYPDGNEPTGGTIQNYLRVTNFIEDPQIAGISRIPNGTLDPRLNATSPALNSYVSLNDSFFDEAPYSGAFGNRDNWALGWTAMDQEGFFGNLVISNTQSPQLNASQMYLVGNVVQSEIKLVSENIKEETMLLEVLDLKGSVLLTQKIQVGMDKRSHLMPIGGLVSGIYVVKSQSRQGGFSARFIVP